MNYDITVFYLLWLFFVNVHRTCVIEKTWQSHQEFQPEDAEENVGARSGCQWNSCYKQ